MSNVKLRLTSVIAVLMIVGCSTAQQEEAQATAVRERLAVAKAESTGEKVSLDESMEEHGTMTLLDDETGEEKVICKYMKTTGSRFGKKVCATPRQWEQERMDSQEEVGKAQRNMDARCPDGAC